MAAGNGDRGTQGHPSAGPLPRWKRLIGWNRPDDRGRWAFFRRAARRYLGWTRWVQFDPKMRYSAVIPTLEKRLEAGARILDVGSGSMGLAFVAQRAVVSVDVRFDADTLARYQSPIEPVMASAGSLPFRDESVDAAVSMDLMEHLPPSIRPKAIRELLRVARTLVVVGFPYGPESARFDSDAYEEEARRGIRLEWREEHVRQSVPGPELGAEVVRAAAEDPRGASIRAFGHEGLLGLRLRWKLLMLISRESRMYGAIFAPLYWIHGRGRRRRAYRRVFVVDIEGAQSRDTGELHR